MGDRNKICDTLDEIKEIKQDIIDKIEELKALCEAPTFSLDTSLPSLNINFAILYFLKDIIAVLGDLNMNEMRAQISNWLISILGPLQQRLADLIKSSLKDCYTCQIEPTIVPWMFVTNPITNQPGIGMNIALDSIDDLCLFKINPNTDIGKLYYDNGGMNEFLWEVIQDAPNTKTWVNPNNGRPIAHFTFLENDPNAFVSGNTNTQPQTLKKENNVFNVKIDNYYATKSLTTYTNDYMDSILPLFDVESLIPNVINAITGSLTNKIKQSDECIKKEVEIDQIIDNLINNGADDVEVVVDDSFFEFDSQQVINIKQTVKNKKEGKMVFTDCCNKKSASIDTSSLIELSNELTSPNITDGKKVEIINKSLSTMNNQVVNNVDPVDQDKAGFEFIIRLLTGMINSLVKSTNSPKNKMLTQSMNYLVEGKIFSSPADFYKTTICIQRNILGELLRKLIYELFLPWLMKNIKPLVMCAIKLILKEKIKSYTFSIKSLLPGLNNVLSEENQERISNALGKAGNAYNKVTNATNNLNLGPVKKELGLKGEGLGKFCD